MKATLTLVLAFCFIHALSGQGVSSKISIETHPKSDLSLKLPHETGINGSAVAWHSVFRKYYCLMAGSDNYPIDVFDEKGNHLQSVKTNADFRGIWINDTLDQLEGNTYQYHDILSFGFDSTGNIIPTHPLEETYELPVPNPQAVLDYISRTKQLVYLDLDDLSIYLLDDYLGEIEKTIPLTLPVSDSLINYTTACYTGVNGYEFGLLNYVDRKVYLINASSGKVSATIHLPSDAPLYESFRFAFANRRIWLFSNETRVWKGYPILKP